MRRLRDEREAQLPPDVAALVRSAEEHALALYRRASAYDQQRPPNA